jgi:hypothetical protein
MLIAKQTQESGQASRKPLDLEILNFCVCALSQKDGTPCSKLVMHENKDVYVVMVSLFSLAQFDPCPRTRMDSGTDSMD